MIDEYTYKKLQKMTGSPLKHKPEIQNLYMQLKAKEEVYRKSRPCYEKVPDNYLRFEINFSTLLRMFGLKEKNYVARTENLDRLAHFLGYHNHRAILFEARSVMERQYADNEYSGFDNESTVYSCCLQIGTKLSFKYHEGREITLVYNGDNLYKVTKAVVSRMRPDHLYEIMVIRPNEKLDCIDHETLSVYTCGIEGGIYDVYINGKPLIPKKSQ